MATQLWQKQFNATSKEYQCPWCPRQLKCKVSNSANNPGRSFVTCDKKFGGCGLFCFLDAEPNDKFRPKEGAASAPQGTHVLGPVVNQPHVDQERLAEVAAEVGVLRGHLQQLMARVIVLEDNAATEARGGGKRAKTNP